MIHEGILVTEIDNVTSAGDVWKNITEVGPNEIEKHQEIQQ